MFDNDYVSLLKGQLLLHGLELNSIHSILTKEIKFCSLLKESTRGYKVIEEVFKLASNFPGIVDVVVHLDVDYQSFVNMGMWEQLVSNISLLLGKYRNVRMLIENEPNLIKPENPAYGLVLGQHVISKGSLEAVAQMVSELQKRVGADRVGIQLDICHVKSACYMINKSTNGWIELNLLDEIEAVLPLVGSIHLANARYSGFGKNHACIFETDEDMEFLEWLVRKLKEVGYDGKMVLEFLYEDYLNCWQATRVVEQIDEILSR